MKKDGLLGILLTCAVLVVTVFTGCSRTEVAEEMIGSFSGSYEHKGTEYVKEVFGESGILSDYIDLSDHIKDTGFISLTIYENGEWRASIDGNTEKGKWQVDGDLGTNLKLKNYGYFSDRAKDHGWSLKKRGDKYIFGFNSGTHYEAELEKSKY